MVAKTLVAASIAFALSTAVALGQEPSSTSSTTTYHTVEVSGVKIFYREAGVPDKPVLLLLHGYPTSSRMFDTLIPILASGYHVIAPDYPGFGYSDAAPP